MLKIKQNAARLGQRVGFLALVLAVACLAIIPAQAGNTDGRWLHVRVVEQGNSGERVSINVPLSFIASLLPMIETNELSGGTVRWDGSDLNGIDLYEVLNAVRDAPDADFITVRSDDEDIVVAKERGFIVVRADTDDEKVRVRFPLAVVDALLSTGNRDELDLNAALEALALYGDGDLVTVQSNDSDVRIWIDSSQDGGR